MRIQMMQKSWKIEEAFPRFVKAQAAKGVTDKTILTYLCPKVPCGLRRGCLYAPKAAGTQHPCHDKTLLRYLRYGFNR